jgi:PAS domain S-box-containing protein
METRGNTGKATSQTNEHLPQAGGSVVSLGRPDELSREHLSYLRLFFLLVVSIFLAEVVAMTFIYVLPPIPYHYSTLIDAGVMVILIFPALYFLSFRPLIRHIERRQEAEAAVRQLSRIVEQTEDTVVVTDCHGVIEYVNPSFERLTGFTKEEVLGKTPRMLRSGLHDRNFYRTLWDTVLRGDVFQSEIANRKKSGELFYEVKTITPLRDANGTITHFVATGKDITEQRHDEEKLRQAYNDLELRIQDRTEELRFANAELEDEINVRWRAEEALQRTHAELELRVEERTKELAIANRELTREIAERKEIEGQLRLQTTAMEAAANGIVITDCQGNIQWANPAMTQISGYDSHELLEKHTRIFSSSQHNDSYYHHMWETIHSGEVWRGETINQRKDGTLYVEEQTITPVRADHGQITHFIAIKQDITERKQAEEKLEQRNLELQTISSAERNQRQFSEALIEAALILNRSLKLRDVLSLILEQIRGAIPYQLANILFIEGDSFYDACHLGDLAWPTKQVDFNNRSLVEDFPLLNRMCQSGKPVLVVNTEEESDWTMIEGLNGVRSLLFAPLLVENKVIGFVNLFSDRPGFFTPEMRDRLVAFAAHAAAAIQNAWLFEQVQASTERLQSLSRRLVEIQENERLYISRELHDEAGQVLTSLLVDLRLLEKNASQPESILKIVAEMERSLNGVIENLHRMAMALRPASLDHVGLVAALRQHVEAMRDKHDIQATFRSSGVIERLPGNVETILYRTVQEALTNVVRHARATRVDVVLMVREDKLVVLVEDDGVGFDPNAVSTDHHLGLFGIRERSEMIGATLVVESEPGKGTTIMMEVGYADTFTGRR